LLYYGIREQGLSAQLVHLTAQLLCHHSISIEEETKETKK